MNRLIAVVDQMGNKTGYAYDALDNIAKVTDALKQVTSYTYDKQGNLLSEKDALGNTVKYAYTLEGWLHSITKADGTVLTFDYDKTGSLLTQSVGEGQTIESNYNEIGKLTQVSSKEGTIAYQYDDRGYLVSVTNVNGDVVSYTYDAYGNKTSMTYPEGRKVSYTYDAMNRMITVAGLDGEVTTYAYDVAGRRTETRTGGNASANPTNSASALTTTYRYDSVGNLLEQATSGVSSIAFSYSYNKNGYITGEKRTEGGKATESAYTYDPLGQLTNFLKSTGYSEQYTYDKAGNMLQKVITGENGNLTGSNGATITSAGPATVTLKMQYNKGNQLISMANGQSKIAYSYDKNGSMVKKVLIGKQFGKLTDTYTHNALDQLTGYQGYDGFRQQLTYDANGMRLSKSETGNSNRSTLEELLRGNIPGLPEIVQPVSSQTNKDADGAEKLPEDLEWASTEYLYDITQEYYQVIQETTKGKNGSTTTAYTYGLERIAAHGVDANNNPIKTSYVYDGRGSVAQSISLPVPGVNANSALVKASASVAVQSFSYTAFGEQMGTKKVTGWGYNAEAFDATTGMINLRARQYEPDLGRFSQKDVALGYRNLPISINRMSYALNSPISLVDTSGMEPKKYVDPFKAISDRIVQFTTNMTRNIKGSVAKVIDSMKNSEVQDLWTDYREKAKTLTKREQSIISETNKKLKKLRKGTEEYYLAIRSACTLLGEARVEILSEQLATTHTTKADILKHSETAKWNALSVSEASANAQYVLTSGDFWYAYGGNGSKVLQKVEHRKFDFEKTRRILKGLGYSDSEIRKLKGIDCIGLFKYIYNMNDVRKEKPKAAALGSTQNAILLRTPNNRGASIVAGNIYEIGVENVMAGMAVYKYTWDEEEKKWIVGHIGYYDGTTVIEAKGSSFGVVSSPLDEWDAFSWLDGIVLDDKEASR